MLLYYTKLALLALRQNPVMSALMVLAMAIGIGVAGTTLTVYMAMDHNPMAHKNDRLYKVQLKTAHDDFSPGTVDDLPKQLSYPDAMNLLEMGGGIRQVAMYRTGFIVKPESDTIIPFSVLGRATSRDFFAMFDVPFIYGDTWSMATDDGGVNEVVIDKRLNDKLFNGTNSVGKTIDASSVIYTIVGVIETFTPTPLVYDLNNGSIHQGEQIFLPIALAPINKMPIWGNTNGWKREPSKSFEDRLNSERYWVQYWVEFASQADIAPYQQQLDNYVAQQKELGRMPSDTAYGKLRSVGEWLVYRGVVDDDTKVIVALAFMFLGVCLVNMVGLLLAKFLRRAPHVGVRRALGASQGQIFLQHLVEVAVIGLLGGLLGLVFAAIGLHGIRGLYQNYSAITEFHPQLWALLLAISAVAALLAGILPAWRICQSSLSHHLKIQ